MTERHTLIAFTSTLAAIVLLVMAGAVIAILGHSTEALGIGGAVTGLIGVIGTFKPRTTSPDTAQPVNVVNTVDSPVPVADNTLNLDESMKQ